LLAVREHRSVPSAARALSCPPTEVTEQLAALERQFGVTLVEGGPRASRLTPAGARLAAHAERVLAELDRAQADVATLTGRVAGRLTVGAPPYAAQALLGDTLVRLRETAPEVELLISQLGPDEELGSVLAGDLDVAVVGEYGLLPRRPQPAFDRRELAVEPVLVAVPDAHPLPGPAVRLAELAGERWLAGQFGGPAHELLRRAAGIAGFEPAVVGHCDDGMALALVAAGHGVALVSASAAGGGAAMPTRAQASPVGVRLLSPLDPSLRRTLTAVARLSRAGDPAVVRLLDALSGAGRRFVDGTPGATRPAPADLGAAAARPGAEPGRAGRPGGDRNGQPSVLPPPSPGSPPARSSPDAPPIPFGRRPTPADTGAGPADPPNGFPLSADLGVRSLPSPELPQPGRGAPPAPAPPTVPASPPPTPGDLPGRPAPPPDPRTADRQRRPASPGDDLPRRPAAPAPDPFTADRQRRPAAPAADRLTGDFPPRSAPDPLTGDLPRRPSPASGDLPKRRPPGEPPGSDAGRDELRPTSSPASPAAGPPPLRRARIEPRGLTDRPGDIGRFGPLGTLPPAPDEDVRLSIFEELQSEWFSRRGPASGADGPTPWDSPADDGWRAAARLAEPPTAGTTTAGLPKRMPQALYVPGAVAPNEPSTGGPPPRTSRERGRLASYRDGVRRGRHAEPPPTEQ
jgi:DNA-binding transcriptional LysR family regulator